MAFTYEPTTEIGTCRLLFGDTDSNRIVFQDAEWAQFLTLGGNSPLRAKGHALMAVASNRNLRILVAETLGLRTDGAATAREFRLQAEAAFEQADMVDAQSGGLFDIAEFAIDPFGTEERLHNEALRSGI